MPATAPVHQVTASENVTVAGTSTTIACRASSHDCPSTMGLSRRRTGPPPHTPPRPSPALISPLYRILPFRPPADALAREWEAHVPRGHLSDSSIRRVGADPPGASRSRFVHGFTSAYSVTTSSLSGRQ